MWRPMGKAKRARPHHGPLSLSVYKGCDGSLASPTHTSSSTFASSSPPPLALLLPSLAAKTSLSDEPREGAPETLLPCLCRCPLPPLRWSVTRLPLRLLPLRSTLSTAFSPSSGGSSTPSSAAFKLALRTPYSFPSLPYCSSAGRVFTFSFLLLFLLLIDLRERPGLGKPVCR
jgi:hypothetical protein